MLTVTQPTPVPDVVEFDGPTMRSLAYDGKLRLVDDVVGPTMLADITS